MLIIYHSYHHIIGTQHIYIYPYIIPSYIISYILVDFTSYRFLLRTSYPLTPFILLLLLCHIPSPFTPQYQFLIIFQFSLEIYTHLLTLFLSLLSISPLEFIFISFPFRIWISLFPQRFDSGGVLNSNK
jgi:hypothetical protein